MQAPVLATLRICLLRLLRPGDTSPGIFSLRVISACDDEVCLSFPHSTSAAIRRSAPTNKKTSVESARGTTPTAALWNSLWLRRPRKPVMTHREAMLWLNFTLFVFSWLWQSRFHWMVWHSLLYPLKSLVLPLQCVQEKYVMQVPSCVSIWYSISFRIDVKNKKT